MLNFSSEIEYDDRFDLDKYRHDNKPDKLVDRSRPAELRLRPVLQKYFNREQLF
jgi:hypothetical protein